MSAGSVQRYEERQLRAALSPEEEEEALGFGFIQRCMDGGHDTEHRHHHVDAALAAGTPEIRPPFQTAEG